VAAVAISALAAAGLGYALCAVTGSGSDQAAALAPAVMKCAASAPQLKGPGRGGADEHLVPSDPAGAAICRYNGLNTAHPNALASTSTLSRSGARTLASTFNTQTAAPSELHSCPADTGEIDLVIFRYASDPAADVTARLTGCRFATNGSLSVRMTPTLIGELSAQNAVAATA
jgi:hypothetical protein